jgi:integrase
MVQRITKLVVEALKAGSAAWDSALSGFGVRARESGACFYVVKYGTGRRGRARWLTIGRHGGPWVDRTGRACTLTADLARDEALRLLGEKAAGHDPAAKRDATRSIPTLGEFADRYLAEYAAHHKKPRSVNEDRANLGRVILPALGRLRLDHITRADVVRFHLGRKSTPTNANRCLALLSHMFSMAERWGLRPDGTNPARNVERFKEVRRQRFLAPAELGRLASALTETEADQPFAVAAVRLLILTGARVSEILTLRWEHVDLDAGLLRLPDSKTGARAVRLNAPSAALLSALPRFSGNPYVVAGRKAGAHFVGLGHVWKRIRALAGLGDVRLHDLRHSFASVAVAAGASLPLIGGLLGHASPATTQRYAHAGDDPLRAMAERAGETIARAMKYQP